MPIQFENRPGFQAQSFPLFANSNPLALLEMLRRFVPTPGPYPQSFPPQGPGPGVRPGNAADLRPAISIDAGDTFSSWQRPAWGPAPGPGPGVAPGRLSSIQPNPIVPDRSPAQILWERANAGIESAARSFDPNAAWETLKRPFTPSTSRPPIVGLDPSKPMLGNLPGAVINANPVSIAARNGESFVRQANRGISALWNAAKTAGAWATTPENQWQNLISNSDAAAAAMPADPVEPATPAPAPARSVVPPQAPGYVAPVTQPGATRAAQPAQRPVASNPSLPGNVFRLAQEFQALGYSPIEIAGILGHGQQESGQGMDFSRVGDSGSAFGAFQWRNERKAAFDDFLRRTGMSFSDPAAHARFADWEMRGGDAGAARAYRGLKGAQTVEDAAAAFGHFERPQGYDPERYNPALLHGWGNRLQNARNIYAALSGEPLPPATQGFYANSPPQMPYAPDRPIAAPPDYSEADRWLNAAAPQRSSMTRLEHVLRGLAAGAAQGGDLSQLIANIGAGGMQGVANFRGQEDQDTEALRNYSWQRGGIAGNRAANDAAYRQGVANTQWQNAVDRQSTDYQNATAGYTTSEANRRMGFEVDQANREAQWNWEQTRIAASKPREVSSDSSGVTLQLPDGSYYRQSWPKTEDSVLQELGRIPDVPQPLQNSLKYQSTLEMLGPGALYNEVLKDIVKDGSAAFVLPPEVWAGAQEAAKSVDKLLAADADVYAEAVSNAMVAYIQATMGQNTGWLNSAAQMGNYGAQLLAPGGQ